MYRTPSRYMNIYMRYGTDVVETPIYIYMLYQAPGHMGVGNMGTGHMGTGHMGTWKYG